MPIYAAISSWTFGFEFPPFTYSVCGARRNRNHTNG
jgi:hypothetical protein